MKKSISSQDMEDFANKIASLCIKKYETLGKTGKPSTNEWTVLSGIILENIHGSMSLVSLATGTKCLGGSELSNTTSANRGLRISDSHAEVLVRRAFLRYLYDQVDLLIDGNNSDVFIMNSDGKFEIKNGTSFHFFSSQTPCGDCSIFPKEDATNDTGVPPVKLRRIGTCDEEVGREVTLKICETTSTIKDTYRTGAKCVKTGNIQDPKLPGVDYHVVGPLRTKPGRGDPTLSLSCSDKLAK